MAEDTDTAAPTENEERPRRWLTSDRYFLFVILALVAVAAAAFGAGLAVGGNNGEEEVRDTFAHRLEAWADCLAEDGAAVPGVDARADGGFTVDVEAGFFDEFEVGTFLRAAIACREILPLEGLVEILGVPGQLFEPERRPFEPEPGFPPPDLLEELERGGIEPLLELLGELPPGQLERICRGIFESDGPGVDEGLLRRLGRLCERAG